LDLERRIVETLVERAQAKTLEPFGGQPSETIEYCLRRREEPAAWFLNVFSAVRDRYINGSRRPVFPAQNMKLRKLSVARVGLAGPLVFSSIDRPIFPHFLALAT